MHTHALKDIVDFEVRRTLTKRRFWLSTLLIPGMIAIIFAISFLSSNSSQAAADAQAGERFAFEYVDLSGLVDPALATAAGGTVAANPEQGIADVKSGAVTAFFAFPADPSTETIEVYGVNEGIFANGKYGSVAGALLQSSVTKRIGSPELSVIAQGGMSTHTTAFENGQIAGGPESVIAPLLYLFLLYIVVILMGNQMLSATVEEKENRVTEMILTTTKATTLIVGKVVSLFVIGLVQILVFAAPIVVGYVFFREKLHIPNVDLSALEFPPRPMIIGALLLLGSFGLFTATLVAIGAAMPTVKDASPYFGGVVMMLFLPLYVAALIVTSPNATIVQVFTLFPYTAPVTALLRNGLGALPMWMAVVDILVLFVLSAVVLQIAVRVFKYGSIEYARKVSLKGALARRASE